MTIKKWRGSGARATKPCPATRPALSKWLMGLQMARKFLELEGTSSAFTPDYAPEEMYEIASKLYRKSR